ncbi:hypothetical protein Tco_1558982 [Tanacetum coccineum]
MISFPPLGEEDGTEGPMVIEAEVEGHLVHRMYVDGGASLEILYEHCFNQLCLEIRNQMVLAITYLVGFSGEIIWPLGQVSLLVKIGDEEHSTSAWMNNRKARCKENQSNPIHIPQNVEVPSDRQNGHTAERLKEAVRFTKVKPGYLRLETSRHDQGSTSHSGTQVECPGGMFSYQTKEKEASIREKQGNM